MGEQTEERQRLTKRLKGFDFRLDDKSLNKNLRECDEKFIIAFNEFLDTWFWKELKEKREIKRPCGQDLNDIEENTDEEEDKNPAL